MKKGLRKGNIEWHAACNHSSAWSVKLPSRFVMTVSPTNTYCRTQTAAPFHIFVCVVWVVRSLCTCYKGGSSFRDGCRRSVWGGLWRSFPPCSKIQYDSHANALFRGFSFVLFVVVYVNVRSESGLIEQRPLIYSIFAIVSWLGISYVYMTTGLLWGQ